ncbi:MAG: hypothetical protein H6719_11380 [Sandaracinaceae bacterium]|nr:hypothetical protein [Sandaracinaceae bacterium]
MHREVTWIGLVALALAAGLAPGCGGASVDRETTISRLREAMTAELAQGDATALEDHNQLVEDVRDGNVFDGMRRAEVETQLGRGEDCGTRPICSEHDFLPTDWIYEVGQREGVPWGPTMVIGFDRQGFVENVYTLTRR